MLYQDYDEDNRHVALVIGLGIAGFWTIIVILCALAELSDWLGL